VPNRRAITILLVAWALGLGLVQASARPVYQLRPLVIAAATGCGQVECAGADDASRAGNCLAVCLAWCAAGSFAAVSEGDAGRFAPATTARAIGFEHFHGAVRRPRPPLPPPRD
jgi:hypothetical protein